MTSLTRATARPFAGSATPVVLAVALLFAAHLIPIWTASYFPSQDGPEHAYNAVVLRDLGRPDRPGFNRFFRVNHRPVPNWTTALITRGLLSLVSPVVADKLLVSGYLASFFATAVYAVWRLRAAPPWGALVVLPFGFNYFLFMGFYNFCLGLTVLLLVVGYWLPRAKRPTAKGTAGLAALCLLLYFCHLVTFLIAVALLGSTAVWVALDGGANAVNRLGRAAGTAALAVVFPLALSALFVARQAPSGSRPFADMHYRLAQFFNWSETFRRSDGFLSYGLTSAFVGATAAAVWARRSKPSAVTQAGRVADPLLLTAAIAAVASLVAPNVLSGGSYVIDRLSLLALIPWAVWLAVQPLGPWASRMLYGASAVATIGLLIVSARSLRVEDGYVREYVSAARHVATDATVLSISYARADQSRLDRPPFRRTDCMAHALGWIVAERHAVDVMDYEAATGYFPILFMPSVDSTAVIEPTPDEVERLTPAHVKPDYVLVWTGGTSPTTPTDRQTADQLARGYRLTFQSPGRGYVRLFERRDRP
jgi:hypothetical protein